MMLEFKYTPHLALGAIRKSRSVNADGSIRFSSMFDDGSYMVVASAIKIPSGYSQDEMDRAVKIAFRSSKLPTQFSEREVLDAALDNLKMLRKGPLKRYIVFCYLTLAGDRPSRFFRLNEGTVSFPNSSNRLLKRIEASHRRLCQTHSRIYQQPEITLSFRPVLTHVKARTPHDAIKIGRDSIDDVRGLINLFENSKTFYRKSYGKLYPINKAKLTPIMTVHTAEGDAAFDSIWFDNAWEAPSTSLNPHKDINGFTQNFGKWISKIRRRHGLSASSQIAIRQYVRSTDSSDWRQAFLNLWIAIEYLTSSKEADYRRLIDRASKIFYDHQEYVEILQHLRHRRNQLIHEAEDAPVSETIVYQAKHIVEELIRFALANRIGFRNRQEMAEFLDLPTQELELKRRIALAEKALEFLRS